MKPLPVLLLVVLLSCLTGCEGVDLVNKDFRILKQSRIERDAVLPTLRGPQTALVKKILFSLSLDSVYNSGAVQELRFIILAGSSDSVKLVRLKRVNDSWIATASLFGSEQRTNPLLVDHIKTDTVTPRMSWKRFLERLAKTDFSELRTWYEIPGYDIGTHGGTTVIVEIADNGRYFLVAYPNIQSSNPELPEIKEMRSVFRFIERQLGTSFEYVRWEEISNEVIYAGDDPFESVDIKIDTTYMAPYKEPK